MSTERDIFSLKFLAPLSPFESCLSCVSFIAQHCSKDPLRLFHLLDLRTSELQIFANNKKWRPVGDPFQCSFACRVIMLYYRT